MTKKTTIANIALFIENRIFPVIFISVSLKHIATLYINAGKTLRQLSAQDMTEIARFILLSDVLIVAVLIPFNLLIAYALLITRNLRAKPEGFLEIFVPFIATFWFLTYNIIPFLPPKINVFIIPSWFLPYSVSIGSALTLAGLVIASCAIFHLRKSFGIFVQVRDIVTKGLYRHVRHPIYFGHILAHLGFFFITPRLYAFILSAALLWITLLRAQLEEKKLAENSEDYRAYMRTTPFIIPSKTKQ